MKLIKSIILLTLFFTGEVHALVNCNREGALKKFKASTSLLDLQNEKITKFLNNNNLDSFSYSEFFGHNFDFSKTEEKVSEIKELIENESGIASEYKPLTDCLKKLSLNSELEQIKEVSINLQKNKIILLERNEILRDSLRTNQLAKNELPALRVQIEKESVDTKNLREKLEDNLLKNESKANKEKNNQKKLLLNYESELTKIKIELLNLRIKSNEELQSKISTFEKATAELSSLSTRLNLKTQTNVIANFEELEKLWLNLSKENYIHLFQKRKGLNLPQIPIALDEDKFSSEVKELNSLRDQINKLRVEIVKEYSTKKNQEIKLLNQLISSSNYLRSAYFKEIGASYLYKRMFSFQFVTLLKGEVLSSPHRVLSYFYSKYLFINEKISLGREGYIDLFYKLGFFFLLFIGFVTLKLVFSKFNNFIDRFLGQLASSTKKNFLVRKVLLLWNKIRDNSVSFLWLLTLLLGQHLDLFEGFSLVVEVFQVYLFSKIIKSLLTLFLGSISRLDMSSFSKFKIKANETSDIFKNIFLFYFLTMIALEATVGRVYLYTLTNFIVFLYSVYKVVLESSRWEEEFTRFAEKKFSGAIVEKFSALIKFTPKYLRALLTLLFILVLMVFDIFISLTENFEVSKKISANLFKKQIENVEAEDGSDSQIPDDYLEHYSLHSLDNETEYVTTANNIEETISNELIEWIGAKSDEHSLVVYGDKGIGKTTTLKKIGADISSKEDVDVKYVKLPSKIIDKKSMHKFVESIFNETEDCESFDIYKYDRKLEKKTIVIIDEAQNIFLTHTGGFEAYYALVNLINLNTENIFWLMSFNKYSWLYLDRAFGRTQYFRNVFEIKGWNDLKIKELIMKRHSKTSFRLSYDLLISATRSQDEIDRYASIESKFFKLLWELSNGNPRTAIFLWISALSRKNRNAFNVNIPKEIDLHGIEKLPDDLMFVIAHVLKHENLSSSEIELTTDLSRGLVRNSIKLALEKKFFFKDERNRYMIDISTQYGIIRYLRVKNFIYGN